MFSAARPIYSTDLLLAIAGVKILSANFRTEPPAPVKYAPMKRDNIIKMVPARPMYGAVSRAHTHIHTYIW